MSIDEQELRDRLEHTAAQAAAPRFTAEELIWRIRRRRARVLSTATGAVAAAAAIAVALPMALSGAGQPQISVEPPATPELSYTITVNGQTHALGPGLAIPRYVITPGENLTITVDVSVQAHLTVTALWLGITDGVLAPRLAGPADMTVLAAYTHRLTGPAEHRFRMRWAAPEGLRPGSSRQLSAEWIWSGKPWIQGGAEGIVAELDVQ